MTTDSAQRRGEEFREDHRAPGHGNAAARRVLSARELAPLTTLNDLRSMAAVLQSLAVIGAAIAFGVALWPSAWVLLSVVVVGIQQHGLFILAHEAAHYRLHSHRGVNDVLGRCIGIVGGVSMCTYRVTHRLHHNNLYGPEDPDTAIHGGYPRGVAYLWKKLIQDLAGLNAWKTYAYFFGAPALNEVTQKASRPLDDTSPQLRAAARRDRWSVVGFHLGAPLLALAAFGWRGLALYAVLWLLPLLTVLQPILRLRAVCEHGAVTDLSSPLTAARTTLTHGSRSGRPLDAAINAAGRLLLFPHHVNHHVEHHLYPAVPHYHLPRLHRLLARHGALAGAEVRDLRDTWALVFAARRLRRTDPGVLAP
ncbi:MAG: fatty acid desaturase [Chitinophagaceae bacterium]|nr:fatty acid desaturase [Rubrivivax sp.]